jgi:hypothetical protein
MLPIGNVSRRDATDVSEVTPRTISPGYSQNVGRCGDMSNQDMPLPAMAPETGLFLEPTAPGSPAAAIKPAEPAHHPQPKPHDHMCTCGKVREACVHDEIRALWHTVGDA